MSEQTDALAALWTWFAQTQCPGYSPLYDRICTAVAADREILDFVATTPPDAHLPLALLAAVHSLVLDGRAQDLALVYAGRSDADPGELFAATCRRHRDELAAILAVRRIQTNDCGRSAVIAPGLRWITQQFDEPFGLVDVGSSAGLSLLFDRYRIDYGDQGASGPVDSPVTITCEVLGGHPPITTSVAQIISRVGIDRSPIDVTDAADANWLLACVWPDTGRFERTAASIALAQKDPPALIRGDALDVLPDVLAGLAPGTSALVLTTWSYSYFSIEQRQQFEKLLSTHSNDRRIAWLSADGPGTVEAFADADVPEHDQTRANVLGVVTYDHGVRRAVVVGFVHQHGAWVDWRAS